MPRFSAKAKEIHDKIWYNSDVIKANKLLGELKDPLDIAFGKLFIIYYWMALQHQQEFLENLTDIENENKILKDHFLQFIINFYYCLYYVGWNNPSVSKEQAEKYMDIIERSHENIEYEDNWEKYYCFGWYYAIKAAYEVSNKGEISNVIKFQTKCIEAYSKVPEEGEYYSATGHIMLGWYYMLNGDFEEAEKSQNRGLHAFIQYNNFYQLWPLGNLFRLNLIKGNLQKAKESIDLLLDVAKQHNSTSGIFNGLTWKGFLSYQEGNYDEALIAYQEGNIYRKQYNDPLQIFWGYFQIFEFYYLRFTVLKDKAFLTKAEQTLSVLQELSKTHSDIKTIFNYSKYAQALILKHGNIRKRGSAIDILEELIEFYPNNIEFPLNLLELLFEDALLSEDQETIDQIDELMEIVNRIPLRNNPQAIFNFISQQIFLAKYIFYIKSDVSVALNILHNATDHVRNFKLSNLEKIIDAEIQILEKDIRKWENVDSSIKERIKASEFNKYIEDALNIADNQLRID